MPTKNPRIHVVLEKPLFERVKGLAKKNGLSVSLEARELIREALRYGGSKTMRVYTGKHFSTMIGKYRAGRVGNLDDILVEQVHG
ncbi:MAG: hypothetical protein A2901_01210 [Elusimicrobia bacterium RIFCSPLOWO2_01_FULL_54_10]|nr:MAG: hypothetical protein A2901_01210 [Elusimicrobia bacterium RIFCSPLOWO2_01_FULL_54_10]